MTPSLPSEVNPSLTGRLMKDGTSLKSVMMWMGAQGGKDIARLGVFLKAGHILADSSFLSAS